MPVFRQWDHPWWNWQYYQVFHHSQQMFALIIDYALPVQLHALTDLVELLDRITFGWSHWWHGNLSLLSAYFMIKSQLYFLVRPNPHEAYIMSSFFFFNWTLLFLFISLLLSAGIFQGCSAFCRLRADPYVQSLLHNLKKDNKIKKDVGVPCRTLGLRSMKCVVPRAHFSWKA